MCSQKVNPNKTGIRGSSIPGLTVHLRRLSLKSHFGTQCNRYELVPNYNFYLSYVNYISQYSLSIEESFSQERMYFTTTMT